MILIIRMLNLAYEIRCICAKMGNSLNTAGNPIKKATVKTVGLMMTLQW